MKNGFSVVASSTIAWILIFGISLNSSLAAMTQPRPLPRGESTLDSRLQVPLAQSKTLSRGSPIILSTMSSFAEYDRANWMRENPDSDPMILIVDSGLAWMSELSRLVESNPRSIILVSGHGYPGDGSVYAKVGGHTHETTLTVERLAQAISTGRNSRLSKLRVKQAGERLLPPVLAEFRTCSSGVCVTKTESDGSLSVVPAIAEQFVKLMWNAYGIRAASSGVLGSVSIDRHGVYRIRRYTDRSKYEGEEAIGQFATTPGVVGAPISRDLPGVVRSADTVMRDGVAAHVYEEKVRAEQRGAPLSPQEEEMLRMRTTRAIRAHLGSSEPIRTLVGPPRIAMPPQTSHSYGPTPPTFPRSAGPTIRSTIPDPPAHLLEPYRSYGRVPQSTGNKLSKPVMSPSPTPSQTPSSIVR